MEAIPVLMLWLCMPLDASPVPVLPGDLLLFPSIEVVERELAEADGRCARAASELATACYYKDAVARNHWRVLQNEAIAVWHAWNHLHKAQLAVHDWGESSCGFRLGELRTAIGLVNYYHGQMPPHAPVQPKKRGER